MSIPDRVRIVEVGPRDGLQNEPRPIAPAIKIELIERLAEVGLGAVRMAFRIEHFVVDRVGKLGWTARRWRTTS